MGFRNVVNDETTSAPRLRIQQSLWALGGMPTDGNYSALTEFLDKVATARFGGVEVGGNGESELDQLAGLLRDRRLGIGLSLSASEVDGLLPAIEIAHRMRAQYLNVRVKGSLMASPDIADLLEEMFEVVNDAGLPMFVETHRGTVTQDLRRTVKVINRFKKIRFTGDFSHYVVAGELREAWSEEVWEHFRRIARKCGAWHGRVGFGEQVQNDIGDGSGESPQQFKKLWALGMSAWLKKAQPGDILPFTCELGPAPYALMDLSGSEISDRWEQALVIKRLAEEAWTDAESSVAVSQYPTEGESKESASSQDSPSVAGL